MREIRGNALIFSDIHGEVEQLRKLLRCLEKHGYLKDRWAVFLGDYVDKGKDTANVLELLVRFRKHHPKSIYLCGNHDLNLAKALELVPSTHGEFYRGRAFERNYETMKSYSAKDIYDLSEKMPESHKKFLRELEWCSIHPDYLFVHSGFDDDEKVETQLNELANKDTTIFKPEWLYDPDLALKPVDTDKTVVSGHVYFNQVVQNKNHVDIDTGAGYGGCISVLVLPEGDIIQPREDHCVIYKAKTGD